MKRISELRRSRNLTQDALAEELGITAQAVSKWENDISCPDIMILPQLADYFSISILFRGLRECRRYYPHLDLVDVQTAGGEHIVLTL